MGAIIISLLKEITCRYCKFLFFICRRCWRGQAYCCDLCRKQARRRSHRKAQRKYRQTEKGKEAHRLGERRRRMGKAWKKIKKSVADQPSRAPRIRDNVSQVSIFQTVGCLFCGAIGQVVSHFPRRGYNRRHKLTIEPGGERK